MKVVIIGAGVTGLAVAWKLSKDHEVVLLEKRSQIGGIATTFRHRNFMLDSGPHKVYSRIPGILAEMRSLLGSEAIAVPKTRSVLLGGIRLDYPVKFSDLFLKLNPLTGLKLVAGYGFALLMKFFRRKTPKSYADYFRHNFGVPAYNLVFRPIAEKSWGNPENLAAELARRIVPDRGAIIRTPFRGSKSGAENFYYPRRGFIELSGRMLDRVLNNNGRITFNAEVKKFITAGNKIESVEFSEGGVIKNIPADYVVSSAPVSRLPVMFNAPPEVAVAASELKYRSLLLVYVLVKKPKVMGGVWTFVPDRTLVFQRISEQKNFSQGMGPSDQTVLTAEVLCNAHDAMWNASDGHLYARVIRDLVRAGFVAQGEAEGFYVLKLKDAYPVYDVGHEENLRKILDFTDGFENFITLGRLGLFNYNNADQCIDMAIWASNHIRLRRPVKEWIQTRRRFDKYVIAD